MTVPIEKIAFFAMAACVASFAGHVLAHDGLRMISASETSFATQTSAVSVKATSDVMQKMERVRARTSRDNRFVGDEGK